MSPRARTRCYAALLPLCATLTPLRAADSYYTGPDNSLYSNPTNWSPAPPADDDNAYVSPTSPLTITLDHTPNNVSLNNASFSGSSPGAPLTVNSAANFSPYYFTVGPHATFNQTDGQITANSSVGIGGANTSYSLSGTAYLSAFHLAFGPGATISQSGGTVRSDNAVTIAASSYSLSNGSVSGDDVLLDSPSPTSFSQTGGTVGGYYSTLIGRNASYSLANGTLSSSYAVRVGGKPSNAPTSFPDAGSTLTQTGGTLLLESDAALSINSTPGSHAFYTLSAGTLTANGNNHLYIGQSTTGTLLQTGGSIGSPSSIPFTYIGYDPNSTGTYSLSNTGTLTTANLYVGYNGNASLAQSGGLISLTSTARLTLAAGPSSTASYSLSAGSLSASTALLADQGTATFSQSGGSASFHSFTFANAPGSSATYNLSAGNLTSTSSDGTPSYIAYAGSATVNQSGGTLDLSYTPLTLAAQPGSSATYNLSGGLLATATLRNNGTFSMTGGSAFPSTLILGPNATFAQSAGYTRSYNVLVDAPNATLAIAGTATLSTGALAVGTTTDGTFTQTGGKTSADGQLLFGGAGSVLVQLAGGELGGDSTMISSDVSATFLQTGGSHGSQYAVGIGTNTLYALSAGTLSTAGTLSIGSPTGTHTTLQQTGGLVRAHDSLAVSLLLNGSSPANATYLLSAGTLTADNATLASTASALFSQSGGSAIFSSVTLANAPSASATLNLSAGTFTTTAYPNYRSYIAYAGSATVNQSGGVASFSPGLTSYLTLADQPNSSATYNLSGTGSLAADTLTVANQGSATLSQSGGSLSVTSFTFANAASSSLTYNLSAGTFTAKPYQPTPNYLAYAGSATLNQTGGTLDSSETSLILASQPGSSASYTLADNAVAYFGGLTVGGQGDATFNLDGGTLHARGLILHGTFNHTAGTFSEPTITLSGTPAAPARYTLLSGFINSYYTTLNAYSTFSQSGGDLFYSGTLTLNGPNSLYTLAGDGRTGGDAIVIGDTSTGTFLQSGGHAGSNYFTTLGQKSGATGYYQLSGGEIHTANLLVGDAGAGTFLQTGGTLTLNDTTSSLIVGSAPTGTGSYTMTAGTIDGGETFATLTVARAGQGSFTQSGGTLSSITSLVLAAQRNSAASYTLSAGSVSIFFATIADQGTATFTQTGGTLSFPNFNNTTFTLANAPYSSATYLLSGGSLLAAPTTLANAGHAYLLQTGGSLSTPSLTIAAQPTANGIYDLLAGSLATSTLTNHGTLFMSPNASITLTGSSPTLTNTGSLTLDGSQSWPAHSTLTNTLVTYLHSDPTPTGTPTLNFSSASPAWAPVVFDAPMVHLASLTLTATTQATLAPTSQYLSTPSLTIADTAQLDLTTSTLLTTIDPATLRQYLLTNALISSSSDPIHRLAYAPLDSRDPTGPWSISLALQGDANLDGTLNPDDYALLDRSLAQQLPNPLWTDGDFNYDGTINNQDYLLLDTAVGQAQRFTPGFLAQRESQFGAQYVSELLAAVPEPTLPLSSILYSLSSLLLTRRRRPR